MKVKTGFQTQAGINYIPAKQKTEWLPVLGGLGVCIAIILLAYILLKFIFVNLLKLSPEVTAAIIVTSGTIIISVFTVVYAKKKEHRLSIQTEQRAKKASIYEKFIETWFEILFAKKLGKSQPTEKEILRFFQTFTKDLITWGNDDVIAAFSTFRNNVSNMGTSPDSVKLFNDFEKLLLVIRHDLGHNNKGLKQGDLLRIFITDYDTFVNSLKN